MWKKQTDLDFVAVLDPNGTVLLRLHEPDKNGDSPADEFNVKGAMKGQTTTAIEPGTHVPLSALSEETAASTEEVTTTTNEVAESNSKLSEQTMNGRLNAYSQRIGVFGDIITGIADQSQQGAREVSELVGKILDGTNLAVASMRKSRDGERRDERERSERILRGAEANDLPFPGRKRRRGNDVCTRPEERGLSDLRRVPSLKKNELPECL